MDQTTQNAAPKQVRKAALYAVISHATSGETGVKELSDKTKRGLLDQIKKHENVTVHGIYRGRKHELKPKTEHTIV